MTTSDKPKLIGPFANCVKELRANNTSPESQIDAWMVIFSIEMINGKDATSYEEIGTTKAEIDGFWNRNPEIAKAGALKLIANCKFPK